MKCESGSKTDTPCWREADEGERYCTEHLRVFDLGKTLDGYIYAMTSANGYVESEAVEKDPGGELHRRVFEMRDEIMDAAGKTAVELKVAELLADRGERQAHEPTDPGKREYMVVLMVRADACGLARGILAGDADRLDGADRLRALDAINEAEKEASLVAQEYREEYGFASV